MNDSAIFGMLGLLIGGAGVWAVMRASARFEALEAKADAANAYEACAEAEDEADRNWGLFSEQTAKRADAEIAHDRLSDAHNATKERIERALDCVTPSSAHVGKKMAAILTGER